MDNGRVTKVEYFIDSKLIQTYTGELPHNFEEINPDKKQVGDELKILFKVYDDDGNITEAPVKSKVGKDTRTELHDEKWMYIKRQEE